MKFLPVEIDTPTRRFVELTPRFKQIQTSMVNVSQRGKADLQVNESGDVPQRCRGRFAKEN